MRLRPLSALVVLGSLAGCVAAPPPPLPLVAYPGPTKTPALFAKDDASCRAAAAQPAANLSSGAAPNSTAKPGQAAASNKVSSTPELNTQASTVQPAPESVYLQCMASRDNIVRPLLVAQRTGYAYYVPDPLYPYGDYAPFLYGDAIGLGFFGGCCGYYHGGFYRGDYGGFNDRGGFHDGGGFRGGGFHGGGFHH